MAIENRSLGWRIGQSWYVLLTLAGGMLSGFAFLYMAIRARRGKWLLWSAVYFGVLIWLLSRPQVAGPDGQDTITDAAAGGILLLWLASIIHALVARREFLTILDAQDGGAVGGPYADTPVAGYAPDPAGDFAIFTQQPQRTVASPPGRAVSAPPPVEPDVDTTPPPPPPRAAAPVAPPPLPPEAAAPVAPPLPPLPPRAEPQAPRAPAGPDLPPPFSGPAPFGGRKPFEEDADRPAPPAPPQPPRRPGRQVDY